MIPSSQHWTLANCNYMEGYSAIRTFAKMQGRDKSIMNADEATPASYSSDTVSVAASTTGASAAQPVNSKSYRGIVRRRWSPSKSKWGARISDRAAGNSLWLGTFETEELAARAHDEAAIRLRGSSAELNFPAEFHAAAAAEAVRARRSAISSTTQHGSYAGEGKTAAPLGVPPVSRTSTPTNPSTSSMIIHQHQLIQGAKTPPLHQPNMEPVEHLTSTIDSITAEALSSPVGERSAVLSCIDKLGASAPENGSRPRVGDDLASMARARLQSKACMTQDHVTANKKSRRMDSVALSLISPDGSDALHTLHRAAVEMVDKVFIEKLQQLQQLFPWITHECTGDRVLMEKIQELIPLPCIPKEKLHELQRMDSSPDQRMELSSSTSSMIINQHQLIQNVEKFPLHRPYMDPVKRLTSTVDSITAEALSSRVGELTAVRSCMDKPGASAPENGSRPRVGGDLASMARARLQSKACITQDHVTAMKRSRRMDSVALNLISPDRSEALKTLHRARVDTLDKVSTVLVPDLKGLKGKVLLAVQEKIRQINDRLIDIEVEVSYEGSEKAAAQGREGVVVTCSYKPVAVRPPLAQTETADHLFAVRFLIPLSYPQSSPVSWSDCKVPNANFPSASGAGKIIVQEMQSARDDFERELVSLPAPFCLRTIAECWGRHARNALAKIFTYYGGGTFSTNIGVWDAYS